MTLNEEIGLRKFNTHMIWKARTREKGALPTKPAGVNC